MDKLQAAEKPLTFLFTYLERHWIDRQINESRVDILPMKQLIWYMWDSLIFKSVWPQALLPELSSELRAVRAHEIELEKLEKVAKFVHYLRVISKPTQLESDFKATRKVIMAGAVVNPRVIHPNRFEEFVQWYCNSMESDIPRLASTGITERSNVTHRISDFIQVSLQFWNEEEGRMAFLRFDKGAQITVRNHLKGLLLLPNLEAIKLAFRDSIIRSNVLEANSIYRLLSNRKSLLAQLDQESEVAFIQKGTDLLKEALDIENVCIEEIESNFINLLGQFYKSLTELIQMSLASRPEIFEARSKALRVLLNQQPQFLKNVQSKGFAARSLAKFADFIIRNYSDSCNDDNLSILLALFRLIDEKEEFQETFGKLLGIRLLTGVTRVPSRFENDLLRELKQICGSFYVKSFEKMFSDVNDREISGLTVLTAGTWNIRGKLLPGHTLLDESNNTNNTIEEIEKEISGKRFIYQQKHPKRKLFWSPILSSIEFSFKISKQREIEIKGNFLHFNVLKTISELGRLETDLLIKKFGPNTNLILSSLYKSGLIATVGINEEYSGASVVDLYTLTLNELSIVHAGNTVSNRSSNTATPIYFNTSNSNNNNSLSISPIDKSILLQCSITRILKQLRSLSLTDLFYRISMLPKLLTKFSPSLPDVLDALKQLHEKEFVQLVFGDGIDEIIELTEDDLKNLEKTLNNSGNKNDKLFIKYLA